MAKEIERKWLCEVGEHFFDMIKKYPKDCIVQFYTKITDNEEIRFRSKRRYYTKTIKIGTGLERTENETCISREAFFKQMKNKVGKVIEKFRHIFYIMENMCEIDHYYLIPEISRKFVIIEIEFKNIEKANEFRMPIFNKDFIINISEVTYNKKFKNKNIALYGFPINLTKHLLI